MRKRANQVFKPPSDAVQIAREELNRMRQDHSGHAKSAAPEFEEYPLSYKFTLKDLFPDEGKVRRIDEINWKMAMDLNTRNSMIGGNYQDQAALNQRPGAMQMAVQNQQSQQAMQPQATRPPESGYSPNNAILRANAPSLKPPSIGPKPGMLPSTSPLQPGNAAGMAGRMASGAGSMIGGMVGGMFGKKAGEVIDFNSGKPIPQADLDQKAIYQKAVQEELKKHNIDPKHVYEHDNKVYAKKQDGSDWLEIMSEVGPTPAGSNTPAPRSTPAPSTPKKPEGMSRGQKASLALLGAGALGSGAMIAGGAGLLGLTGAYALHKHLKNKRELKKRLGKRASAEDYQDAHLNNAADAIRTARWLNKGLVGASALTAMGGAGVMGGIVGTTGTLLAAKLIKRRMEKAKKLKEQEGQSKTAGEGARRFIDETDKTMRWSWKAPLVLGAAGLGSGVVGGASMVGASGLTGAALIAKHLYDKRKKKKQEEQERGKS